MVTEIVASQLSHVEQPILVVEAQLMPYWRLFVVLPALASLSALLRVRQRLADAKEAPDSRALMKYGALVLLEIAVVGVLFWLALAGHVAALGLMISLGGLYVALCPDSSFTRSILTPPFRWTPIKTAREPTPEERRFRHRVIGTLIAGGAVLLVIVQLA